MELSQTTREYIKALFAHWNDTQPPQESPLILSFDRFRKGNYEEGERNLYIVWRGKQALYVGISRRGIWGRWFNAAGGHWDNSTIAQVIARNAPASAHWKIELRHIITDLNKAERELIAQLRPLFNTIYRPALTAKQSRLYKALLYGRPRTARGGLFQPGTNLTAAPPQLRRR